MLNEKSPKNNATFSHAHSILTVLKVIKHNCCHVSFGQELPDENRPSYTTVTTALGFSYQ